MSLRKRPKAFCYVDKAIFLYFGEPSTCVFGSFVNNTANFHHFVIITIRLAKLIVRVVLIVFLISVKLYQALYYHLLEICRYNKLFAKKIIVHLLNYLQSEMTMASSAPFQPNPLLPPPKASVLNVEHLSFSLFHR